MNVLVTGSSGLIGTALTTRLVSSGHSVSRLVRGPRRPGEREFLWNPAEGRLDPRQLEALDAVVHLAGENISEGRWTPAKKERILASRVDATELLASSLSRLDHPPRALICASAIGYYGDRGSEVLTEDSGPGKGFLAEVCRAWEAASAPAAKGGMRIVHLRIGVVLSPEGGALTKMLPLFRKGLGGRLGSGRQYMSWIVLEDLVEIFARALTDEFFHGPVNAVTPNPLTNAEFTKTLSGVLSRPAPFPAPAFALRLALGQMADELLLSSTRVLPARLLAADHVFLHPGLEGALCHLLAS